MIEQSVGANARAPELAEKIRSFWHRPPVIEIERDLPPLRLVLRYLPRDAVNAKALTDIEKSPEAQLLRSAIANGNLREIEGSVSRIRRLLSLSKVDAAVAWIEGAFDEGEDKILVWGWHIDALEILRERLAKYRPAMITGATRDRDAEVKRFQTDPSCRIFLGQIQAAGQAITLTAGRRVVFVEQAFTPGANYQALRRCHRIGQHRPVVGEVLVIPESIDVAVANLLVRKTLDIAVLEAAA